MAAMQTGHLFISYSRKDDEIVRRIINFLGSRGIKVWIDKQGLVPGEPNWIKELESAIENAFAVIVVLSPNAKSSEWVGMERQYARLFEKQIFPVLAVGEAKSSVPLDLSSYQRVDIRTDELDGLIALHSAIVRQMEKVDAERREAEKEAAIPVSRQAEQASRKIELKIGNNAIFENQGNLLSPPLARAAYSDRMSWILATMAKLSYIPFEESEQENARLLHNLESGGFKLIRTFNNQDTQAFLAKSEAYAVLVFRGTESKSLNDLRADMQTRRQATAYGKVHYGYSRAYANVANPIEEGLSQVSNLPLYIAGHSSGGAIGTLAAQQLESALGDQIAACYTFGSPRVGSADFERIIKSSIYRVVNALDIVTMIPLLSMGYVHIGDVRYLGPKGELHRNIPSTRNLSFMLGLIFRLGAFIRDHSIDEYIRKLERVAIERNRDFSIPR